MSTVDFVSPRPTTSRMPGKPAKASITGVGSPAATTTSTSPIVSRNRRRLPQYSARRTAGSCERAATMSAATGRALMIGILRSLL